MKHPVDTSQWGEFVVGELFDVQLSDGDNKPKKLPKGTIPLVSAGNTNNGIVGSFESDTIIFPAHSITIDMFGQAFYQPEEFQTVSHGRVNILVPNFENNENIGRFIVTILNAQCQKYSFTEMLTSKKIKAEFIKLPLKPSADPSNYTQDDIDWDYMETVMSRVTTRAKERLASLPQPTDKKKTPVDTSAWGDFVVGELFETNGNKTYTGAGIPKNNLEAGSTPRITVTDKNNGIIGYFNDTDNANYRVYENFISVSFLGTVFWHPYKASVDMKVHVLNKPKGTELNEERALFLVACIKKTIATFSYAEQLSASKLYDLTIKLPLKPSADPFNYTQDDIDWDYMERFMQAIKEKAHERVASLRKQI